MRFRYVLAAVGAGAGASAWWNRPIFDPAYQRKIEETKVGNVFNVDAKGDVLASLHRRAEQASAWKVAPEPFTDNALSSPSLLYDVASQFVVFLVVNVSRLIHAALRGKIDIQKDENYYNFLRKLRKREEGQALITVSNHRSLLDDPTLLGCMIPYLTIIQPKNARFTLCAEEYCFKQEVNLQDCIVFY